MSLETFLPVDFLYATALRKGKLRARLLVEDVPPEVAEALCNAKIRIIAEWDLEGEVE